MKRKYISKEEWKKTPKDYKSIINGVRYKLYMTDKGTSLIPIYIKNPRLKKPRILK